VGCDCAQMSIISSNYFQLHCAPCLRPMRLVFCPASKNMRPTCLGLVCKACISPTGGAVRMNITTGLSRAPDAAQTGNAQPVVPHCCCFCCSFLVHAVVNGCRVSLEDISDLYARHWWWSRVVNPRPRRRPRSTANKSRPTEGQNLPPGPRDRGSSPAISGGGGSMEPDRAAFRGKDAAALADDFPLSGPQSALPQPSPFGRTNIQTVPSQSMEEAVGDDPKTAEAVAAAAKIALAGAASSAAASLHSSQALQLGRSSRRPLRLAGKRRNSHAIEGATADVVEQLADELEVNDYGG